MPSCRACGEEIYFKITANGKRQPISVQTGITHFADCPQAKRFQKPPAPNDVCLRCGSRNLDQLPGFGPHAGAIRCHACGAHRWLSKTSLDPDGRNLA